MVFDMECAAYQTSLGWIDLTCLAKGSPVQSPVTEATKVNNDTNRVNSVSAKWSIIWETIFHCYRKLYK